MSSSDFDAKQFALLADFRDDDCEALLEFLEPKKIARGRKMFREGSESDGLVLLASGRVSVTGTRSDTSAELGPGAVFGALSMIAVGTRAATVSTVEACEIWVLPRQSWHRFVDDHPRTACRLAEAIVVEAAGMIREVADTYGDES